MATKPLQKTVASPLEADRINATILQLNAAKSAASEGLMVNHLQAAFKDIRYLIRGRLD